MARFTFTAALASVLGLAASSFVTTGAPAGTPHSRPVVLYQFSGGADGNGPTGPLIADQAGNLYGTTELGGAQGYGFGVVFELSPPRSRKGSWTETVLHSFNGEDGADPLGGLAIDAQGNLYGT